MDNQSIGHQVTFMSSHDKGALRMVIGNMPAVRVCYFSTAKSEARGVPGEFMLPGSLQVVLK
jgi:hypothetical protein